jgi:hypothetical protein
MVQASYRVNARKLEPDDNNGGHETTSLSCSHVQHASDADQHPRQLTPAVHMAGEAGQYTRSEYEIVYFLSYFCLCRFQLEFAAYSDHNTAASSCAV